MWDVNCAFKLFKKSLLEGAELKSPGALINAELLAQARLRMVDPIEVPVTHLPRVHGNQSGGSLRVVIRAAGELIRLKLGYRQ